MYQLVPSWGPGLLPALRYPVYHLRYEREKAILAINNPWVNGFSAECESKRKTNYGQSMPVYIRSRIRGMQALQTIGGTVLLNTAFIKISSALDPCQYPLPTKMVTRANYIRLPMSSVPTCHA
jgi:hypothetical protein